MANKIKFLIHNEEQSKLISNNGYATAKNFSWGKIGPKWEKIIREFSKNNV